MDWLAEQCRRIQEQKLKQERSIRYLKQLFKAWPVKAELEEEKSERQTASNKEKKNDELENSDDRLTAEEKEGLLMMDQLLSKAQKARDLQKKLEEPKKPKTIQSVKQKTKIDHDLNQNDKTRMETGDKKELQKRLQEVEIVGNVQTSKVPQETAHHASAPAKNKPVSCGKPQGKGLSKANPVEKIERQKISQRPQSSSGTRKIVPVHVNAPFQTNPNLRSSKLQTTYKAATAKTLSKSRGAGKCRQ
ncbi:uncharacterized protein LOC132718924 [Ruditapes philippinarum]|uniref:uncharacterized protein LOC132718924 n=1 Tax=Ruditapes philippinarum TaxID=129788 RepID=UPI00295B0916|nr:uncharacterized protein LOC132718924 [Ruditapes philippinarum]